MKKINILLVMMMLTLSTTTIFTGCDAGDTNATTQADDGVTPTITLKGNTNIEIPLGTRTIPEEGYSAFDFQDGDVTDKVQRTHNIDWNKVGNYNVNYSVTDSDGHIGRAVRYVNIRTNNGSNGGNGTQGAVPVISFNEYTVYLNLGENFATSAYINDYSATDAEDGDLRNQVQIDYTNVNSDITGTYVVTYSVTDSAGNHAVQNKMVIIQNNYNNNNNYYSELDNFKSWYSDTCGRTFNDSLYNASTRKYHGTIDCSYQGLSSIDLSALSVFDGIDDLDLSHNNLSYIDFSPIKDIHEMWGLHIDHNTQTLKKQYDTRSERVALFKYFTNIHGGSGNTDDNNAGLNIYFKPKQSMQIFFDDK